VRSGHNVREIPRGSRTKPNLVTTVLLAGGPTDRRACHMNQLQATPWTRQTVLPSIDAT